MQAIADCKIEQMLHKYLSRLTLLMAFLAVSCSSTDPTAKPLEGSVVFSDKGRLYVFDEIGEPRRQLTGIGGIYADADYKATDGFPSWSPDGNNIVFDSNRDGDLELYVISAGGGQATQLTSNETMDAFPSWSPDGNNIVFQSDRFGSPQLFVVSEDGSIERSLIPEGQAGTTASWSD